MVLDRKKIESELLTSSKRAEIEGLFSNAKKGFESYYNIFIMDETQTILGAGCAASTKLLYAGNRIERIHNYKFPYEYIKSFDKLMEKKEEIKECLKKIKSIQPR